MIELFYSLCVSSPTQYTKLIIIYFRIILTAMIIKAMDCPIIFDQMMSLKYCSQIGPE